jgi:hypothetical protein
VAKAAAQRLDAACDEWAAARAADQPIGDAQGKIKRAQMDLDQALSQTKYDVNEGLLWTRKQAGRFIPKVGRQYDELRRRHGADGLIVAAWGRGEWTQDRHPGEGIDFIVGIEPENLRNNFQVGVGRWGEKGQVLRVPYLLVGIAGTFERHLVDGEWSFHPDRGELSGDWWRPLSGVAATRPAK